LLDTASVPLVVDEATLDRAQRRPRAFADIVREHQAMVFSIAYHSSGDARWQRNWRRTFSASVPARRASSRPSI
jgi:hypothetical protein